MVTDKTKKVENPNQQYIGMVFQYTGSRNWKIERCLKDGRFFCRSLESQSDIIYIDQSQLNTLNWLNCNLNGVWYVNGVKQN